MNATHLEDAAAARLAQALRALSLLAYGSTDVDLGDAPDDARIASVELPGGGRVSIYCGLLRAARQATLEPLPPGVTNDAARLAAQFMARDYKAPTSFEGAQDGRTEPRQRVWDEAWGHFGGSHMPADFWDAFGAGVDFALAMFPPPPRDALPGDALEAAARAEEIFDGWRNTLGRASHRRYVDRQRAALAAYEASLPPRLFACESCAAARPVHEARKTDGRWVCTSCASVLS